MKVISTTQARENLGKYVEALSNGEAEAFVFGRRGEEEAVLIKFPKQYKKDVSEITNINAYSSSFDFLDNEPDLYDVCDVIK